MAKQFMRIKVIVIPFLTLAIMLSQLSGCAVVTQDDIVDAPSDVTVVIEDADLADPATSDSAVETSGTTGTAGVKGSDSTGPSADKLASLEQQNSSVLTTEELQELFELGYKTEKYGRENLDADAYNYFCDMFPKRSTGTQADAIAYGFIEQEVTNNSLYEGKTLPSDGFDQYVSWREATYGNDTTGGNNQSAGGNSSNQGQQAQQGNNSSGSNKGSGSSSGASSGGNSGNNGGSSGDGGGNVYEGAYIETETPRYDWEDQGSGENPHGDYDRGYGFKG